MWMWWRQPITIKITIKSGTNFSAKKKERRQSITIKSETIFLSLMRNTSNYLFAISQKKKRELLLLDIMRRQKGTKEQNADTHRGAGRATRGGVRGTGPTNHKVLGGCLFFKIPLLSSRASLGGGALVTIQHRAAVG